MKVIQSLSKEIIMTSKQISTRRKQRKKHLKMKMRAHESIKKAKKGTKLKLQALGRLPKCVEI